MNIEKRLRRGILLSLLSGCVLIITSAFLFAKGTSESVTHILFIWGLAKYALALIFFLLLQRRVKNQVIN